MFGGGNEEKGRMNDVYIIDFSTMVKCVYICVCVCVCVCYIVHGDIHVCVHVFVSV